MNRVSNIVEKNLNFVKIICVSAFLIIACFPFYMVFVMGTWENALLQRSLPFTVSNYFPNNLNTIMRSDFLLYYRNSLIVSISGMVLCIFTASLIGFAIAKYEFRFKEAITIFILITMMVPSQVSIVGYIIEMRVLRWTNTLIPIIVCWIANPFSAFFMIQYMRKAVPNEIIESARIDGYPEPYIYFRIVLPLIKPGIATVFTLIFLWSWNSYMLPLIAISNPKWYTIPLFIKSIGADYLDDYGARMAALSLAIFPVLILFAVCSRTFIKGITEGAVKG